MQSYSVRQAYEFLELTPPVTMEQVRKQWKRLDTMQQRLNEAMNRVQEAIEETSSSSSRNNSNSNSNDNDPQDESTSQRDEHEHEHDTTHW
jgi:hypothetical protein